MNKDNIGSTFDSFLKEEELLAEIKSLRAQLSACRDQIRDLNAENEKLANFADRAIEEGSLQAKVLATALVLLRTVKSELETDPHAEDYYSSLIGSISRYLREEA
jgi:predicted nuclease with TOPRIM domain